MNFTKYLGIAFLCALAPAAHSQEKGHQYTVGGCVLWAQAYTNKAYGPKGNSRYTLQLLQTPENSHQWDLTAPEFPNEHSINIDSPSPHPYGRNRRTTLYATLHQYDIYEERVTFHNLDLGPVGFNLFGEPSSKVFGNPISRPHNMPTVTPRYLVLKEPVTAATPSGIAITLLAQGEETLEKVFSNFNGNADALFIQIRTSPSQKLAVLPLSPLDKKYPKPVRITLDCVKPNGMVWYMADNTFKTIAVGMPHLNAVTHLDTLTLIVRQRVDLKSVPVTLTVPIDRSVHE